MTNSGRVYFSLSGDFIPAELNEAIGIKPTIAKMAGERIPGKVPKCSMRDYSTEEVEGAVVDVSTPAIGFEADAINFLHRVGGTIDIDTYRNTADGQQTRD